MQSNKTPQVYFYYSPLPLNLKTKNQQNIRKLWLDRKYICWVKKSYYVLIFLIWPLKLYINTLEQKSQCLPGKFILGYVWAFRYLPYSTFLLFKSVCWPFFCKNSCKSESTNHFNAFLLLLITPVNLWNALK